MKRTINSPVGPISLPLLLLACAVAICIWGNSLVPGAESTHMSLSVLGELNDCLGAAGVSAAWISNLLVRKTGHVLEYLLFGGISASVIASRGTVTRERAGALVLVLFLVPSIDETIQLFVPGRSGMVIDVLLDCTAAALGTLLVSHLFSKSQKS